MKINLRGFRVTVSKQCLNILPFYALLHQMCCKAVAGGSVELLLPEVQPQIQHGAAPVARVLTVR